LILINFLAIKPGSGKGAGLFLPLFVLPQNETHYEDAAVGLIGFRDQQQIQICHCLSLHKHIKVGCPTLYPSFFNPTCKDWLHLFQENHCKNIIVNSPKYWIEKDRIMVLGFVIMNNHVHIT
jgi:hypothetical protein